MQTLLKGAANDLGLVPPLMLAVGPLVDFVFCLSERLEKGSAIRIARTIEHKSKLFKTIKSLNCFISKSILLLFLV